LVPLVTDAPGYNHITGAIGGTLAGMYGADHLCMTTPSGHLAIYGERARYIRKSKVIGSDACSMYGDLYTMKIVRDAFSDNE